MPKQTVTAHKTDQPKQLGDNFIVIHDEVLQGWICDEIQNVYDKTPFVEVETIGNSKFAPVDKEYDGKNHSYEHGGKIHCNIYPGHEREYILERIEWALPKGWAFGRINYMQIIKYEEGSHFPWHMDIADDNDTGTAIVFLNDNFIGGQLNVGGHRILTKRGTIVGFNNATEVWHTVEPIQRGERWCLAIWFGAPLSNEELDEFHFENAFRLPIDVEEGENATD